MSEWENTSLGELITYKKGYAFKSSLYDINGEETIVRVSDTTENSININSCNKIKTENVIGLDDYRLNTNDIVIATVGSWADNPNSIVGKVIKVPCFAHNALLNQNAVRLRGIHDKIEQNFLYYILKNEDFSSYLLLAAQGSANQASITLKDIFGYLFNLPPLPEQQAIASVLSAMDDKIDLLQRKNQTLEQMAATLFRQWFIEEAKEDWEDGCLGDIATNIRINADTQSIQDNEIYIGLEHIERRNIALSNHGYGSDVASNKSRFIKTDVLFGKLRPYFHKVCMAPFDGVCSTDILVLRAKQPAFKSFILFAFFQDDVVAFANLTSGGTRMPRADWKTLSEYPIAIPPMEKVLEFEALANPSISKIFDNLKQIQTLQTLRDTLLPKLISGEVRLKGFETLSEA